MFNPVPPASEPEPNRNPRKPPEDAVEDAEGEEEQGVRGHARRPSKLLVAAATCQILCGLFTLLPWTRHIGDSTPGYEAPRDSFLRDYKYDGLAGKLNLAATPFAFLILFGASRVPRMGRAFPLVLVVACWSAILSGWLGFLWYRLEIWREYGLSLAVVASVATAVFTIVAIWKSDDETETN